MPNVEKVELLPYHVFGVNKYKEMNIPYRLDGVPPLSGEELARLSGILNDIIKNKGVKLKEIKKLISANKENYIKEVI